MQQKYPQILWITLWMAGGILRKPVLAPILSLGPPKYSAMQSQIGNIVTGDDKK